MQEASCNNDVAYVRKRMREKRIYYHGPEGISDMMFHAFNVRPNENHYISKMIADDNVEAVKKYTKALHDGVYKLRSLEMYNVVKSKYFNVNNFIHNELPMEIFKVMCVDGKIQGPRNMNVKQFNYWIMTNRYHNYFTNVVTTLELHRYLTGDSDGKTYGIDYDYYDEDIVTAIKCKDWNEVYRIVKKYASYYDYSWVQEDNIVLDYIFKRKNYLCWGCASANTEYESWFRENTIGCILHYDEDCTNNTNKMGRIIANISIHSIHHFLESCADCDWSDVVVKNIQMAKILAPLENKYRESWLANATDKEVVEYYKCVI